MSIKDLIEIIIISIFSVTIIVLCVIAIYITIKYLSDSSDTISRGKFNKLSEADRLKWLLKKAEKYQKIVGGKK